MNEYDSARMADVLRAAGGYEATDDPAQADLLLLNTCSVREKAQEKVFSLLGRWRELKLERPHVIIGVGGCVASQEGEGITARAPYVDLVFGPQTIHRLPEMIARLRSGARSVVDVSFPEIEKFDRLPAPTATGATAFVSIMEGCSKYCTFCVVPYTRGEEVSRPVEQVMLEVRALAGQGVSEVTLLGQNVNAYRGDLRGGGHADLAALIYFVADVPGIERIRFTTSHPLEFRDSLIEAYRDVPKLASFLHLPVQSGSDRVLRRMKRFYTREHYLAVIQKLRAVRPDFVATTDIISGFPGESDADFDETMSLLEEVRFHASFSFNYSPRPGTAALRLLDEAVPDAVAQARLERFQARQREIAIEEHARLVGTVQRVLVEGPSAHDDGVVCGRTSTFKTVNFPGDASLTGTWVNVRITRGFANTLRGEAAPLR